ncbi:MAG TPA: hypothetical protein VF785_06915 [Gemmatimonadaceae bacterium]
MKASARDNWLAAALVVAIAYIVIGIGTAGLARSAHSIETRNAWRLSAWVLSFIAFASHVAYERLRPDSTNVGAARHAASAVALGAFALAIEGPAASHWGAVDFWRTAALSVVLWPVLTGVPAFFGALVASSVLGRLLARERRQPET